MPDVSVIIPVGDNPIYLEWLPEAIESAINQTHPPKEIIIVDDSQQNLDMHRFFDIYPEKLVWHTDENFIYAKEVWTWENPPPERDIYISRFRTPWKAGFSAAFNFGVSISFYDFMVYLAADDKLMPTAIEDCVATWIKHKQKDAWYAMSYEVEGETHTIPINAAMISRNLWKWLGGYPPSAFVGPDALLLSILYKHAPDRIIKVAEGKPNYWVRTHPDQETKTHASYFLDEMNSIRNKETLRFKHHPYVELQ